MRFIFGLHQVRLTRVEERSNVSKVARQLPARYLMTEIDDFPMNYAQWLNDNKLRKSQI